MRALPFTSPKKQSIQIGHYTYHFDDRRPWSSDDMPLENHVRVTGPQGKDVGEMGWYLFDSYSVRSRHPSSFFLLCDGYSADLGEFAEAVFAGQRSVFQEHKSFGLLAWDRRARNSGLIHQEWLTDCIGAFGREYLGRKLGCECAYVYSSPVLTDAHFDAEDPHAAEVKRQRTAKNIGRDFMATLGAQQIVGNYLRFPLREPRVKPARAASKAATKLELAPAATQAALSELDSLPKLDPLQVKAVLFAVDGIYYNSERVEGHWELPCCGATLLWDGARFVQNHRRLMDHILTEAGRLGPVLSVAGQKLMNACNMRLTKNRVPVVQRLLQDMASQAITITTAEGQSYPFKLLNSVEWKDDGRVDIVLDARLFGLLPAVSREIYPWTIDDYWGSTMMWMASLLTHDASVVLPISAVNTGAQSCGDGANEMLQFLAHPELAEEEESVRYYERAAKNAQHGGPLDPKWYEDQKAERQARADKLRAQVIAKDAVFTRNLSRLRGLTREIQWRLRDDGLHLARVERRS